MARQNQGRVQDFTGQEKARLAKEHADEQAAAAERLGLITAEAAPENQGVIDVEPRKDETPAPTVEEIGVTSVDTSQEKVKFRVNESLEQVTIGHGNNYDFAEGQEYRATKAVYDYLDDRGFIYH